MVNSSRDKRVKYCDENCDNIIVKNAWIYLSFFTVWFIVASLFGFPIKEHKDKWHTSNQATYQIVDKRAVFKSVTASCSELQMTLREPGTQFMLKDVSEEVYNNKKVGEYITLELTNAEKFSDSHDREGICGFLNVVDSLVLLGTMILAVAFVGVTFATNDISGRNLLMVRGHLPTKVFTIMSVILGIVILKSKYLC